MVCSISPEQNQILALTSTGCQSVGVGATPKHYLANEIEQRRRFISAEIGERALREIYLYPFQLIMKHSDPWCLMTRYV
jgi:beta-glucosidase